MKLKLLFMVFAFTLIGCSDKDATNEADNALEEVIQPEPKFPKEIAEGAFYNYSASGFPKFYSTWGASWVERISKLERLAAYKVANTKNNCDIITTSSFSDSRSVPPNNPVVYVECRNGYRTYFDYTQLKSIEKEKTKLDELASASEVAASEAKITKAS